MIYTRISRVCILVIVLVSLAGAQLPFGLPESRRNEFQVSFEAIPAFENDTSIACVYFHYRIPDNFFVYVRNPDPVGAHPFVGRGELLVELVDQKNVTAARQIKPIYITRRTVPEGIDAEGDIQGFIRLTVPEGTYQILFTLEDRESDRKFVNREHKVTTRTGGSETLDLSFPMFVSKHDLSPRTLPAYRALNYGTDVLFGTSTGSGYLFQVRLDQSADNLSVRWKLTNQRSTPGLDPLEFSGNTYEIQKGFLMTLESTEGVFYQAVSTAASWYLLFVPLPLEKLEQGRCTIDFTLSNGPATKSVSYSFSVHWPKKPLSLRTIDLAIDALRVLATEEEVDQLRSFSLARQSRAFHDFWRSRSRDTSIAYNGLMVEYYRRVDYALQNYSITREADGYKTDRGKVYILYGPPSRSDRLLGPNLVPAEVWTYERLGKRFIFTDPRKNGTYSLTSTETL